MNRFLNDQLKCIHKINTIQIKNYKVSSNISFLNSIFRYFFSDY